MKSLINTYRHLPAQERPRFALAVAALLAMAGLLAELGRVVEGDILKPHTNMRIWTA